MLNVTNFVDDDGGGPELFKYVDLGMRDKMRATSNKPEIKGMVEYLLFNSNHDEKNSTLCT